MSLDDEDDTSLQGIETWDEKQLERAEYLESDRVFRQLALEELRRCRAPTYDVSTSFDTSTIPLDFNYRAVVDEAFGARAQPSGWALVPIVDPETELVVGFGDTCASDAVAFGSGADMNFTRPVSALPTRSIKGSSQNIPFLPGGFDQTLDALLSHANRTAKSTDQVSAEHQAAMEAFDDPTKCIINPLHFEGYDFPPDATFLKQTDTAQTILKQMVSETKDEPDVVPLQIPVKEEPTDDEINGDKELAAELQKLMVSTPNVKPSERERPPHPTTAVDESSEFQYSIAIRSSLPIPEFAILRPNMARQYPFDLDPFQQAAVVCMEAGVSVFVAAHTSAGKTAVAEYAIALCRKHKTRAIYTSPIKALSNQKYRDFSLQFGSDHVGLITGDINLNGDADCIIMTTEILRSMLYNGSEAVRDLEWVIFDEVHYISNDERGHVWEEVLIMLPAHVKIVMLSATVPNSMEFADWVGRIKNRTIYVVFTHYRPVPLEHHLYLGHDSRSRNDCFKVVDQTGFLEEGYRRASATMRSQKELASGTGQSPRGGGPARGGGRGIPLVIGGRGGGRGGGQNNQNQQQNNNRGGRGGGGRGGGGGGPAGNQQHQVRVAQNQQRGGGGPGAGSGPNQQSSDRQVYETLVQYLTEQKLTPVVVFVFSRVRCNTYAEMMLKKDLTTKAEKAQIRNFFRTCLERLSPQDRKIPQVMALKESCSKGFAVHHSGILPLLKETVEMLFQQGLIKVLFATETFAMGVNMPARCVVFDSNMKHDGQEKRQLLPGEYIQMAGRAGRRGLDSAGTVILLCKNNYFPGEAAIRGLMISPAAKLESKFRVTYPMLLNLLRVEQLKIEDMLQRSFVERKGLREALDRKKQLDEKKDFRRAQERIDCEVCFPRTEQRWDPEWTDDADVDAPLAQLHRQLLDYLRERSDLWPAHIQNPAVRKLLAPGRLLVLTSVEHGLTNSLCMLVKSSQQQSQPIALTVLVTVPFESGASLHGAIREADDMKRNFHAFPPHERGWLRDEHLLRGTLAYGVTGCAPPLFDPEQGRRLFRLVPDVPLSALVAITAKKQSFEGPQLQDVSEMIRSRPPGFLDVAHIHESVTRMVSEIDATNERFWSEGVPEIDVNRELVGEPALVSRILAFMDRAKTLQQLATNQATGCPQFEAHFNEWRARCRLNEEIKVLEHQLSAAGLLMHDELLRRLDVLKKLNYVEKGNMVSFKGKIACELHHAELLLAELILENHLQDRTPAECAALLSTLTCQHKLKDGVTKFPEGETKECFDKIMTDVKSCYDRVMTAQKNAGLPDVDPFLEVRFELVEVVYHWAQGMSFTDIMSLTEAHEGLIVRCIQRIDETCKDVRNVARLVGDPRLFEQMERTSSAIKRDIVFAASLYTSQQQEQALQLQSK